MLRSRKEVAGELGISPDSVTRLIDKRQLKGIKFPIMGGCGRNVKWMVDDEEIKRFKARNSS
jgi:hypothetical protein